MDDFPAFLEAMRGKELLHLGHKDADCDALGSAYTMSRVLPGDVGFANGLKAPAQDLADHLGFYALINPDPSAYEYTIIYDTLSLPLLGLPLPPRYALFDHHEPGGHRFASFNSQLAKGAEWTFVEPVESTCSILVDLFQAHDVTIDPDMGLAMAAGIVTDTIWLRNAHAGTLRRLAVTLEAAGLYIEDVLAVVNNSGRKTARRPVVLDALRAMKERHVRGRSILAVVTNSLDDGFAVMETLWHLGGDVCIVGFPKGAQTMVMAEVDGGLVERTGVDMARLMEDLAPQVNASETWGTRALGRIIAPASEERLVDLCIQAVANIFENLPPRV
jgi:nanoRNase/pAp phosphatase (c-di-AMP/oligoRNAs hydrolase)